MLIILDQALHQIKYIIISKPCLLSGDGEPPEWFTENEKLQHFLTEADKLVGR